MITTDNLHPGQESFGRKAWGDAYSELSAADRESPLQPEDLVRLATAAHLLGRDEDCEAAWSRAHHAFHTQGDIAGAARSAFWLGFGLLGAAHDSVEQGYLLIPAALRSFEDGDYGAHSTPSAWRPRSATGSGIATSWPSHATSRAGRSSGGARAPMASPCSTK